MEALGDVDNRNGVTDDELSEGGLEYLTCGKFKAGENDRKMYDSTRWVSLEDLKAVGDEAFDAAMAAFAAREPRLRAAA